MLFKEFSEFLFWVNINLGKIYLDLFFEFSFLEFLFNIKGMDFSKLQ